MIVVGLTGGIGAGKSTVSSLLAARGAVIVDADQIARDLQAPGTPVVAAMVDRFGDTIVDDAGALIRSAVAEIVFNDAEALADLNGIVHPAMQAEIQRQIDAQRATDAVVVLDFPLLAENPRPGLAATIVVDIPVELAIERLVGARGMSEDDARARVARQATREQRREIATHVLDNSGDVDALTAQVDALWSELVQLEQSMRSTWVFGYGSLVSPESLARTTGRVPVRDAEFFPAVLRGYGRRWNYGVGHVSDSWTADDGTVVEDGVIIALGLAESADEAVNGAVAKVTEEDLAQLDLRERDYDRVDVTQLMDLRGAASVAVTGPIVTYVPRASAVARYESARDAGTAAIRQTYWELVDAAFAELGEGEQQRYRDTTPAPDVPVAPFAQGYPDSPKPDSPQPDSPQPDSPQGS